MTALYSQSLYALIFAMALFYLLSVGQAFRLVALLYRREVKPLAAVAAYEFLIACHVSLFAMVLNAVAHGWMPPVAGFGTRYVLVEPLLWLNAVSAVAGVILCVCERRPVMIIELVFLAASTPWGIGLMGDAFPLFLLADMAFFTFRVLAGIVLGIMRQRQSVSRVAAIEAMKMLPEGIACANRKGRVLLMNDTMRACLSALGLPTDLSDMRMLHPILEAHALRGGETHEESNVMPSLDEGIRIAVPERGTWLFVADDVMLGLTRARRIIAFDITEEYQLECAIEAANEKLEAAGFELSAWLEHVQESAENEALIRMHSRVHDVIGQRLSLLHRSLEDGGVTNEQLASMRPALTDILIDLASVEKIDHRVELESIQDAFCSVGVEVNVSGELPKDGRAAEIAVNVIREAATNAVRHAQAQHVSVSIRCCGEDARDANDTEADAGGSNGANRLPDALDASAPLGQNGLHGFFAPSRTESESSRLFVTVTNDGVPCEEVLRAGTGMRGMRHAAEEAGGSFAFHCGPPFTVEVMLPLPCGEGARKAQGSKQEKRKGCT